MKIRKILLFTVALAATSAFLFWLVGSKQAHEEVQESLTEKVDPYRSLYEKIRLDGEVAFSAFDQAMRGYEQIPAKQKELLVLVDFTKPSTEDRFYVIDVQEQKLLYRSVVAHGRGSGDNYATSFSNTPGSHQSSLGFYLTGNTYQGSNGHSLRLKGLEAGINDKAMERAIVIHGADYCDPSFISSAGRLGRSFGCPSLPRAVNDEIIDTIKEGAVLFIYADDTNYQLKSPVLTKDALAMNVSR